MTYDVIAVLDGRVWLVRVPAIDRVTQARNAKEIPVMARELIQLVSGEGDPAIRVQIVPPASVRDHLTNVARYRTREDESRRRAAAELRAAARELRAQHLSYEDVGTVLNVSHQRAHQLVNG